MEEERREKRNRKDYWLHEVYLCSALPTLLINILIGYYSESDTSEAR